MAVTASSDPVTHRQSPRYRILLLASALDGTDVSENAVAYHWASNLAARHEVTILTYRKRERASARHQIPGVRFVEWQEWPLLNRARDLNNLTQPFYAAYYIKARRWIRQALARGEQFDLAHQVTPVAMRYPSPAVGLIEPVVIGPLAGGLSTPPGFASEMSSGSPMYMRLREVDRWRLAHDRWLRGSLSGASLVLGVAPYVRDLLHDVPLQRFEVLSELGLPELPALAPKAVPASGHLRCLFVGRVIRSKGVRDAIRALAMLPPDVTLEVVGDGDDRLACEREVDELGLGVRVQFLGWLDKSAVAERYRESDVFLFPSFREPSGTVVVEAMSHALPVVAAAYGGPGAMVDDEVGVVVQCVEPTQYARAIADALRLLSAHPDEVRRRGIAARRRVELGYLWPAKIAGLEALYAEILDPPR